MIKLCVLLGQLNRKIPLKFSVLTFRNQPHSVKAKKGTMHPDPQTIEHPVPHMQQRYHWDCGITCVMMLLPEDQRNYMKERFEDVCRGEGFHQSTWTIDLCFLLKRFGIRHHMYTTMLGVNESHRRHGYYSRIIDTDKERVRSRFNSAKTEGIKVSLGCLTMDQIVSHLKTEGPVILLVDAGLLACDLCKHNKLGVEIRCWFGGSYKGHYILLTGWSPGRLTYRDPARAVTCCAALSRRVDAARTASGTDHDTILIYNNT